MKNTDTQTLGFAPALILTDEEYQEAAERFITPEPKDSNHRPKNEIATVLAKILFVSATKILEIRDFIELKIADAAINQNNAENEPERSLYFGMQQAFLEIQVFMDKETKE